MTYNPMRYEYHDNTCYDLIIMAASDLTGTLDYDWSIGCGRDYLRGLESPRYLLPVKRTNTP